MNPLTSAALGYVIKALADNKEAKQFKDDFFGAFVKWVRPLFLKDDPEQPITRGLESAPALSEQDIANKLDKLMEDPAMHQEMEAWVTKLKAAEVSEKGVVRDTDIDVEGEIRIGDTNADPTATGKYDRKNVLDNSKVKGKSFRLGDDFKS